MASQQWADDLHACRPYGHSRRILVCKAISQDIEGHVEIRWPGEIAVSILNSSKRDKVSIYLVAQPEAMADAGVLAQTAFSLQSIDNPVVFLLTAVR